MTNGTTVSKKANLAIVLEGTQLSVRDDGGEGGGGGNLMIEKQKHVKFTNTTAYECVLSFFQLKEVDDATVDTATPIWIFDETDANGSKKMLAAKKHWNAKLKAGLPGVTGAICVKYTVKLTGSGVPALDPVIIVRQ
jgi:hypothetical protein